MSHLALVDGRYKLDLNAKHTVYKNAAGKRLPGVTTILGVLAKDALIEWAARVERAMIMESLDDVNFDPHSWVDWAAGIEDSPLAYTVIRDEAANLGTITHARVHAWLNNAELDPEGLPADLYEKSIHGLERFKAEWGKRGLKFVAGELAMVSESDQIGGTADIIARDATGGLHLLDLKTSNPHPKWPWPEVVAQGCQYSIMYKEFIRHVHGVRIGKAEADDIQWVTYTQEQRRAGFDLFRAARAAYFAKRELER